MSISLCRHHLARLKQKRRHDYHFSGSHFSGSLKFYVTTPKPCSCWMCGNPRKFYGNGQDGKTVQEKRAAQAIAIGKREPLPACHTAGSRLED
ncbi:hypothetical protein H9Q10_09205 [Eikenella sp. S3360]|uniref:Uncharacterized protein n=1 Tax=Eikenella glucosivorans TaxID=2766967 RepID=A0ABS0NC68_9NEIS|nr:hypothetical protein [Eikenella glucosivorans]MBH5329844.1 hypothetical protein [Eikenella glucosivorans]